MNSKTYQFSADRQVVYRKDILYPRPETDGYLYVPSRGHFLSKSLPLGDKPTEFIVVSEQDVTLVGSNTFLTNDGHFYTDEHLVNKPALKAHLQRLSRGAWEGVSCEVHNESISLSVSDRLHSIDEPVICLASFEPSNYGSWLYRFIPKLIELDVSDAPILVYYNSSRWMKSLLSFFHGERTLIPQLPLNQYKLREAWIPSCRNYGVYFDQETLDFYDAVADRLQRSDMPERIYLSRQNRQSIRPIVNEAELIERLREKGFAIIQPEDLPFKDQYTVVANAKIIVCPGGSGLFNAVLARRASFVLDIEPGPEWLYPHHNILRSRQIPHAISLGVREDQSNAHGAWRVNVDDIIGALNEVL